MGPRGLALVKIPEYKVGTCFLVETVDSHFSIILSDAFFSESRVPPGNPFMKFDISC